MPVPAAGRKLTIALVGTSIALCLAGGGFIFQGGGFAARLVLAVASLAFVVAYTAKPLGRLIPSDATRAMARESTEGVFAPALRRDRDETATVHNVLAQLHVHGADVDWQQRAAKALPMGKLGQVDEIADFVAFLLSDRSGVVTGSVIDWDQNVIGGLGD